MRIANINLIEDHHEAYAIWKRQGIKNLTLVHIDAHIDFASPPVKDIPLILKEAQSSSQLIRELEKSLLFEQKKYRREALTNLGNYIYAAMRDGIVKDFYWIVPGGANAFSASLKNIRLILRTLRNNTANERTVVRIKRGLLKTELYGKPFIICCLETLPLVKKQCLLDIDTDFLVTPSAHAEKNTDTIDKRKIWITPEALITILRRKIKNPRCTTIAYSVNGGYTPLAYKYLGDELAARLKGCIFRRPPASSAFAYFNLYWERGDFKKAKRFYLKAIHADPTYRTYYNSLGPLYLFKGLYKNSENEFKKILYCDSKNKHALSGLGEMYLRIKRFRRAEKYFRMALKTDARYVPALSGLGQALFELNKYREAKNYLLRYQKFQPLQPLSHYLLGRIYANQKYFTRAVSEYKETVSLGGGVPEVFLRLLRLSRFVNNPAPLVRYVRLKVEKFKGFHRGQGITEVGKVISRQLRLIEKLLGKPFIIS